jgi:hypothetical protein
MNQKLLYIFIFLQFISCSSDKYKSQLLGSWYFYNKPEKAKDLNEFNFYRDSVVINDFMGKTIAKWKVTENQIYLYDMKGFHSSTELTYDYKLKGNNLLDLKVYGDTIIEFKNIIKAKSAIEFLQKSIYLKLDLPKLNTDLIPIGNSQFVFNIYAGFNEKLLKFRTDNSSNLDNIDNEIFNLEKELSPGQFSKTRFCLISDKNIAKNKLDSLESILNRTSIKRIFRAYINDSINYQNNLVWYGKAE